MSKLVVVLVTETIATKNIATMLGVVTTNLYLYLPPLSQA